MGLLSFIAKVTGVGKKVKWSRAKKISVEGPPFFGKYDVYVDNQLDVAMILPKTDGTVHVLRGNIIGCQRWGKYDHNCNQLEGDDFRKGVIDWKINRDKVLFRGTGLPPGGTKRHIYEGVVIADEPFTEDITDEWIRARVHDIAAREGVGSGFEKIEKVGEDIMTFEKKINAYDDAMFGLMLYQETSPEWAKKPQEWHYKKMKRRGEKALKKAKNLLSDIKAGKNVQDKIKTFEWPIITDEMQFRIDVMLKSYKSLFPDRLHDKSLSEKETLALQNDAMKRITIDDVWP